MTIGSTIKKIRRERDMTQESLAEYLGVSVSAVSQWESEKTMPDISLIAPLCNLLGITSDELLGINLEQKEKKIYEICKNAISYSSRGYTRKAYDILTDGLREFPDSYKIMNNMMYMTFILKDDSDCSDEERKKFTDETVRIAEKIMDECLVDQYRHSAVQLLCMICSNNGNTDRAFELAQKMPTIAVSRESLYTNIFKGNKGYDCQKRLIYDLIQFLENEMTAYNRIRDNGEPFYSDEDKAKLRDKKIAFLSLMFEDGDYGFYHTILKDTHAAQAEYYAQKNDRAAALDHLAKSADHAISFIKHAEEDRFTHTSLVLREHVTSGKSFQGSDSDNDAAALLARMNSSSFDFVRGTPEFSAIEEKLGEYAGKWEPAKY